jgi:serine/threonine-protein kinase
MPLSPGDQVGRYRVESLLGQGGMGAVYRAVDGELGRAVALKVIAERPDEAAVARFRREARAASALSHPNVATVFDVGTHEGSPYLVMELLDGHAMRRYVGDAEIAREKKLAWLLDVARALDAAHRAGLVHRDVKPDNVMVTSSGSAKLLDFGIARPAPLPIDPTAPTTQGATTNLTQAGKIVGSPFYMAPEQLKGDVADARSDQFAWGVTAYEVLSGRLPWGAEPTPFALAAKMLNEDARALDPKDAGDDPRVVEVVMRALARDPADRFESMRDVIGALGGRPADTGGVAARRTGDAPIVEGRTAEEVAPKRRAPLVPIAVAALVVLLGAWLVPAILRDVRGAGSEPKKGEPILGLSDSVTKKREAELDVLLPKTAASSSAAGVVRKCRENEGCSEGNTAWCTPEGRKVACCAQGLVGSAAGRCECAPGGTLEKALIDGGCKQGEPKTGGPIQKVMRERFDAFRGCYEKALAKNPKIAGKVTLEYDIAPDGTPYDVRLAGASVPDPVFQDCLVDEVSKLRFAAPLDGHMRIVYPIDFAPGDDTK